jgi:hypothetical protein
MISDLQPVERGTKLPLLFACLQYLYEKSQASDVSRGLATPEWKALSPRGKAAWIRAKHLERSLRAPNLRCHLSNSRTTIHGR